MPALMPSLGLPIILGKEWETGYFITLTISKSYTTYTTAISLGDNPAATTIEPQSLAALTPIQMPYSSASNSAAVFFYHYRNTLQYGLVIIR
jgi:hypothetical protein